MAPKKKKNDSNTDLISIKGARLHNLKNISVEIPRHKITVITGVSGSGKSTLAFDTLYAEGQRRFVESLSAYARQFLERMNKPDVESINGLPPAIAIEQRRSSKNPRSTVGTTTEIYDYFRLLFGRIGTTICKCGRVVHRDSPDDVTVFLSQKDEGDKLFILFPLSGQVLDVGAELERFRQSGFFRVVPKDSDEIINTETYSPPASIKPEVLLILADRAVLSHEQENTARLAESVEAAFLNGGGRIVIRNLTKNEIYRFSSHYECPDCEIVYQEPEPKLFSFNNPFGACHVCQGFGRMLGIDEDLVIPDKNKTLKNGAIHPFTVRGFSEYKKILSDACRNFNIPDDVQYKDLSESHISILWHGKDDFPGIDGFFKFLEDNNYLMHNRILISRYRGYTKCKACGGSRIRTSARRVFIAGKSIPELIKMPLNNLLSFFENIELDAHSLEIAAQVLHEIKTRLRLLVDIGLDYLTLDRLSHSLSGGEAQRINLSTALGSALVGALYVLDEPTIGMHPRDTDRLLNILFKLRDLGNTIVVVEHDPDIIKKADFIIDLGPAAGEKGGEIMYAGAFSEIKGAKNSLTADYISGVKKVEVPCRSNGIASKRIIVYKPRENNLKMDKVIIPLECMVTVTGVSGSGKSTLVHDVIYEGLRRTIGVIEVKNKNYDSIQGAFQLSGIELVDQSSIGKSSRSTPATYLKIFDYIRDLFAQTQSARQMGFKPGYFSFNVSGGRCEVCEGEGSVSIDMQFLPDVHLECEACKGTRYKREVRSILFRGKSIVDVLDMTVDEASEFFYGEHALQKKLQILREIGLGYLKLGQPSTMLSGGESQRIKLASHLDYSKNTGILFVFDEPTTGLHLDDISKLLNCLRRLIKRQHSVLLIEHNLNVISASDWVIDLGPEAGDKGGEIVAAGTPDELSRIRKSHTGRALEKFFGEYSG